MPAAKIFQTARSATTSGRSRSVAWSVFFEADLELFEGEPEVGNGGVQAEIAFEIFEGAAGLGGDLGPKAVAFAFGERGPFVGTGFRLDRLAGLVQRFDGADPSGTGAEDLGDLAGGHALVGEGEDAVAELGGERFHRRHLQRMPTTLTNPASQRKNEI